MSTQSRFWIRKNVLPEEDLSSLIRCNGVIILRKKQHGKQRTSCKLIIQSFSPEKEICTYSVKGVLHLFCKEKQGCVGKLVVPDTLEQSRFSKSQVIGSRVENNLKRRL